MGRQGERKMKGKIFILRICDVILDCIKSLYLFHYDRTTSYTCKNPKVSAAGTDGGLPVALLWGEAGVPG